MDALTCCGHIFWTPGNGRLNYINGYVSKDHDAVDVGLGEYVQTNANSSWLTAYRLLSKSSPCLPEVAIRMKKCPSTLAPVSRTAVGRPGRGEERREKTGMYGGGREGYTGEAGSEYLRNDENVAGNGVLAPWRNKKC